MLKLLIFGEFFVCYTTPMEIVDIVDAQDNVIGAASKDEVRQKGLWCRVSFIVLLNSNNELFLQQRKSTKKTYPLYWSGSAAGHVRSGESYMEAAVRETEEELGVSTLLEKVGKFSSDDDKEIVTVFIGRSDGPFTLEEAAIEKAEYFSVGQLSRNASQMKMTSYLEAVIPLVEKYINESS